MSDFLLTPADVLALSQEDQQRILAAAGAIRSAMRTNHAGGRQPHAPRCPCGKSTVYRAGVDGHHCTAAGPVVFDRTAHLALARGKRKPKIAE